MFIKTIIRKYNDIKSANSDLSASADDQKKLDQLRYDNPSNGLFQLNLDRMQTLVDEKRDLAAAKLLIAVA